ncbi:MAG: CAP domain-containing protein [Myxococcales bacterium]|nr:MAG: CAP domain-containing protein [Myxococcales bacterium]
MIPMGLARSITLMTCALEALACSSHPPTRVMASEAPRPMTLAPSDDATTYLLSLINRDRKTAGLTPVELDSVASAGARRHAQDMAKNGFTAHWGTDGSVPEQRYTEAGGTDMVQENVACLFDGALRELDPSPRFDPAKLEELQKMFMDEVPPNDGHRRNILKPGHHRVGIGLAQPAGVNQPCLAQEFVDDWGDYAELPKQAPPSVLLHVAGTIRAPLAFGGIGIGRIEPASPKSAKDLNATSIYRIPAPTTLYFPPGFKTPKPVKLEGRTFSLDVGLGQNPAQGRYEVSVWGKEPGKSELFMVSLRTIVVK